jgi:tetratricopeptide (TPR) repeat protein
VIHHKIKLIIILSFCLVSIGIINILCSKSGPHRLLQNPIAEHILKTREKVQRKAKIQLINFYMPQDFSPFLEIAKGIPDVHFDQQYLNYFTSVIDIFPTQWDAYLALGLCQYYSQNQTKAIELLQKSAQIEPNFFWTNYNLGLLHFSSKRYADAAHSFQKALSADPKQSVQFLMRSKIYQQILQSVQPFPINFGSRIKAAYENSATLLIVSQYRLKEFTQMEKIVQFMRKNELIDEAKYLFYRGVNAYEQRDYTEAVKFFTKSNEEQLHSETSEYLSKSLNASGDDRESPNFNGNNKSSSKGTADHYLEDFTLLPSLF